MSYGDLLYNNHIASAIALLFVDVRASAWELGLWVCVERAEPQRAFLSPGFTCMYAHMHSLGRVRVYTTILGYYHYLKLHMHMTEDLKSHDLANFLQKSFLRRPTYILRHTHNVG